jgi:hypothetical protein
MNEEHPVDLSALDPTTPSGAFEARLARVRRAARHALLQRRAGGNALAVMARWRVPLMAALVLVMLASTVLVRTVQSEAGLEPEPADEIADLLGVPAQDGDDLLSTATSTSDLLLGGFQQ